MELTFFMVKPDAVAAGHVQRIVDYLKEFGFEIIARKQKTLTRHDALFLYPMHINCDFFEDLVAFITSGPSELFVLKRHSSTDFLNQLVGKSDPSQNDEHTLRKRFGTNIRKNAVHSPNSAENAIRELAYFFSEGGWY